MEALVFKGLTPYWFWVVIEVFGFYLLIHLKMFHNRNQKNIEIITLFGNHISIKQGKEYVFYMWLIRTMRPNKYFKEGEIR